jgi:HK97 family phage portal protein
VRFFRDGIKAAPFAWPDYRVGQPVPSMTDYQSYAEEGYAGNSLIYSAIAYKARAVTAAPLRAYTGDVDHPEVLPPRHPLSKLLARPNPYQSGADLMQLNTVYLNLTGDVFMYIDRQGKDPRALYSLRRDRVLIIPGEKGSLKGYIYVPEGATRQDGMPILPADMMHPKFPNPMDPLEGLGYGLSPVSALAHSADVDNQITKYLRTFFEKGTMQNIVLKFDFPMTSEAMAEARAKWHEVYGSSDNWWKVGILDQSGSVQQLGLTFDQMGFGPIDERNESRILGPFGVPPILIGSRNGLARSTYANYETARKAFWEDTFIPELALYEASLDYYLAQGDDITIRFDTSQVPALRQDVLKQIEGAKFLWSMGVPANTAVQTVGLAIEDIPGGEIGYLPLNLVPVGTPRTPPTPVAPPTAPAAIEPPPETVPPPEEPPAKPAQSNEGAANATEETRTTGKAVKSFTPAAKQILWKAVDQVATSWEPAYSKAAAECFEHDRREVLALVNQAKALALRFKATIDWTKLQQSVADYLTTTGGDNWRSTFVPLIQGVITEQAGAWSANLGIEFDVRNLFAEEWFERYTLQFAQPINATSGDAISELLRQGMRDGWSIDEASKRLGAQFKAWMGGNLTDAEREWFEARVPYNRLATIARSETIRASNSGSQALFTDWGVKRHEWLATSDNRTRDSHRAADGQVRDITEPFDVGGSKLMYPGDPSGPADETIQCRCTVLPVMD